MQNKIENIKDKMELILDVGQLLMENGATTDQIVPNLKKVAEFLKIPTENFYLTVSASVMFLRISDNEKTNFSFRDCPKYAININILNLVNNLISKATENNYTPERFKKVLEKILQQDNLYSQTEIVLAMGLGCSGFSILFGGDIFSAIFTAFCAIVGKIFQIKMLNLGINQFIATVLAALISASVAHLAQFLPTTTIWTPIIACAIFLNPGVPFVNGVLETLNNHWLRGVLLIFRSILIIGSITAGISMAIEICNVISHKNFTDLSSLPEHNFFIIAAAAAAISIAFSIILNTSKKFFLTIGILGAVAVSAKFFFYYMGFSTEFSTFLGAAYISILSIKIRKILKVSTNMFFIPAIVPLFPGVMVFKFLISCLDVENLTVEEFYSSLYIGIDAVQIIFGMAIGAMLPNLIATKFLNKK